MNTRWPGSRVYTEGLEVLRNLKFDIMWCTKFFLCHTSQLEHHHYHMCKEQCEYNLLQQCVLYLYFRRYSHATCTLYSGCAQKDIRYLYNHFTSLTTTNRGSSMMYFTKGYFYVYEIFHRGLARTTCSQGLALSFWDQSNFQGPQCQHHNSHHKWKHSLIYTQFQLLKMKYVKLFRAETLQHFHFVTK